MIQLDRIVLTLRRLVKVGAVLAAVFVVIAVITVEHTAQSEFCSSCHIMEPYYRSWEESAHNHVDCVDCHYEPGILETVEGKFKALSQLAKYVTGTQGTKPWAEVDDNSCTRAGCHSERLIEGPITFGRILFDHRHHLLETRRGRRLRCTTCHSQIVQGQHIAVTTSACFLCHFRPSEQSRSHGECETCHGPPADEIDVAGRPFRHTDYTERGVACELCHRNVTRGSGLARKNRCNSCHGVAEHIERFGDTEYIHENHITLHKIECGECHDEIEHGLQDLEHFETMGDCGQCHAARHENQWLLYAGRGVSGVPEISSRMHETRVDCSACHSERSDGSRVGGAGGFVAGASSVSCMHCHGPAFSSMLGDWQHEVEASLAPLEESLESLEPGGDGAGNNALEQVRGFLEAVRGDGSLGVHNIEYTLALLRSARDRLNEAGPSFSESFRPLDLEIGLPVESALGCADLCHVDVARRDVTFGDVPFAHRPHLVDVGLDCDTCHSEGSPLVETSVHGTTTVEASDCTSCHHGEDQPSCTACHVRQAALLTGELAVEGIRLELDHSMSGLECTDCHTELDGDVGATVRAACVDCHEEGYDELVDTWRGIVDEQARDLPARLESLQARIRGARRAGPPPVEAEASLRRAIECLDAATKGGAHHNPDGVEILIRTAREQLDRCESHLRGSR